VVCEALCFWDAQRRTVSKETVCGLKSAVYFSDIIFDFLAIENFLWFASKFAKDLKRLKK